MGKTKKLSILMVSDFFYPNFGGVESHIYYLSQCLIKLGHKVVVMTHSYGNRSGVRYMTNGLKIYYVPWKPLFMQSVLPTFSGTLPITRTILVREKISLVHGHQAFSTLCHEALMHARTMGYKVVFTDHSLYGFADIGSVHMNKVLQFTLADATRAICVSHTSKENTVLRSGIPAEKVYVVPNAVDTAMFKPAPERLSRDQVVIVVISRLVYRKGADLLVEVIPEICRLHSNVRFIIGGDGPKRVRLEEMREKHSLQDRVAMLGAVPHAQVRSVLVSGHIFLNSSLTEAFCIAILEAASCGLLTVSTRVGGVPEVLPDDLVVLAAPDPRDMIQAVGKAITMLPNIDPEAMHLRMKKLYSWHDVAMRTETVYERALQCADQSLLERLSRYLACGAWAGKLFCLVMIVNYLLWCLLRLWQVLPGGGNRVILVGLYSVRFMSVHLCIGSSRVASRRGISGSRRDEEELADGAVGVLATEYDNENELDDDGKPKRTGTVWTASAHIITAIIGSGVLSLAWATAQLGWIMDRWGSHTCRFFTSNLLADCYRSPHPVTGKRNYTYMEEVQATLGRFNCLACGIVQYVNLSGMVIGYTITASISMVAIRKSNCFHSKGHAASCMFSNNPYMIGLGIFEIFLSQIPNFHKLTFLSTIAAIMSFGYASIGIGLSLAQIIAGKGGKTTLTGVEIGVDITAADKLWTTFRALGDIAFTYSFSAVLVEIQDTLKSPPAENVVMKKANRTAVLTTTVFYMSCGCLGYAAFGNKAPGNMLTGFGFYEPFWLIDLANLFIGIHIVGAYQLFTQPVFSKIESWAINTWPNSMFIKGEQPIRIGQKTVFSLNGLRLIGRTLFVIIATVLAMAMPFFNEILSLLGSMTFWPLTVYFPVEMYIANTKIRRWSSKWLMLQLLSFVCFLVSLVAACGSIQGVSSALRTTKPFRFKV